MGELVRWRVSDLIDRPAASMKILAKDLSGCGPRLPLFGQRTRAGFICERNAFRFKSRSSEAMISMLTDLSSMIPQAWEGCGSPDTAMSCFKSLTPS